MSTARDKAVAALAKCRELVASSGGQMGPMEQAIAAKWAAMAPPIRRLVMQGAGVRSSVAHVEWEKFTTVQRSAMVLFMRGMLDQLGGIRLCIEAERDRCMEVIKGYRQAQQPKPEEKPARRAA